MKKKILFITATRADFSKLKSLIQILQKTKNFDVRVFVTGMHLLKIYGNTVNEIYRSKIKNIICFKNQTEKNYSMVKSMSHTLKGLNNYIKKNYLDLIIIHGDRMEALAGAVAGAFNNIPVAHIEGGELSGTIDDSIRHSISKLSHFHFVSNLESKKRLIQMGESKKSIFVIGSPDLDIMKKKNLPIFSKAQKFYNFKSKDFCIIIFHPVTTSNSENIKNLKIIEKLVLENSKVHFLCILPNNDPGSNKFLNLYKKLSKQKNFKCYPSMRFEYFLTFLKKSKLIIGNSSSGVREAPFFGVNCINVGSRQNKRVLKSNLIHNFNNFNDINLCFKDLMSEKTIFKKKEKNFGIGKSNQLIKKIFLKKDFWKINIQKSFNDLD